MSVHVQHHTATLRVYGPGSYENMDQYNALLHVIFIEPEVAVISGALGRLSRTDIDDVIHTLAEWGARTIFARRAPGHRLPYGRLVNEGVFAGWWRIGGSA